MGSYLADAVDQELRNPTQRTELSVTAGSDSAVQSDTPTLDTTEVIRYNEPIDIGLKRNRTWNSIQNVLGDEKLQHLSEGKTIKTQVLSRDKSLRKKFIRSFGDNSIPAGYDLDHKVDLQLGGLDTIENAWPLEKSVNRSLGKQIERAIRNYPYGTEFGKFYFIDREDE